MAVDRDIGVAVALALGRGRPVRGWEMLAATGVRGLRLLNETPSFSEMLLTEASRDASRVLIENASTYADRGAHAEQRDVRADPPAGPFDYVDLDPYGSPVPFVGPALAAMPDGGILGVTATDMMVLAGVDRKACERRYGARPLRGRFGPEGGLRILLAFIAGRAAERGLAAHPLVTYVRDHHVRAYVRLDRPTPGAPLPVGPIPTDDWRGPSLPAGGPFGPMWTGALLDPEFVERLVVPPTAHAPVEVQSLLGGLRAELPVDVPFFYEANELAGALKLAEPPRRERFARALVDRGFACAPTRTRPGAFRTTAPRSVVETVAKELAGLQARNG